MASGFQRAVAVVVLWLFPVGNTVRGDPDSTLVDHVCNGQKLLVHHSITIITTWNINYSGLVARSTPTENAMGRLRSGIARLAWNMPKCSWTISVMWVLRRRCSFKIIELGMRFNISVKNHGYRNIDARVWTSFCKITSVYVWSIVSRAVSAWCNAYTLLYIDVHGRVGKSMANARQW